MKIDLYTKLVLTVIAIGIGMLVFEQKPMKEAQAGIMGGGEMIVSQESGWVWHMKDGKVRWCMLESENHYSVGCTSFR